MEDPTSFLSWFSMFDNVLHDMMDLVSCFPTLEMECSQTCQNLSCLRVPPLPFDLIAQLNDYIFVKTCLPVNTTFHFRKSMRLQINLSISYQSSESMMLISIMSDLHFQTCTCKRSTKLVPWKATAGVSTPKALADYQGGRWPKALVPSRPIPFMYNKDYMSVDLCGRNHGRHRNYI